MSSKTVSFQYELLVGARGSFCTDLCSLESVQALSQPCPLSSCHNQFCFFQILITLLRLWPPVPCIRTRETFRSFSESYLTAGKAVRDSSWQHQPCQSRTWTQHLPKLLPAFQPLTFTVRETGTQRHQNANLELIQDAATTTFWEQSLRVFPGMAHLFNPMENEGFPHSYTHCWSQITSLARASALQASQQAEPLWAALGNILQGSFQLWKKQIH